MKFKQVKPFIAELFIFVFVIIVVFFALLSGHFIEIIFHLNLLTTIVVIILLFSLLSLFSRIVNIGTRVLFDFLFQKVKEDSYVFINEQPLRASVFAEKFKKKHERSIGFYYLIQMKQNEKIYTFISSSYVDLCRDYNYVIKSGYSSNVFLEAKQIDDEI